MQAKHISELFETKDQFIASVLYASGQNFWTTEWRDSACYFQFENPEKCRQTVSDYYRGELKVDAKKLFDALQTIKGIIYGK